MRVDFRKMKRDISQRESNNPCVLSHSVAADVISSSFSSVHNKSI